MTSARVLVDGASPMTASGYGSTPAQAVAVTASKNPETQA